MPDIPGKAGAFHDGHNEPRGQKPKRTDHDDPRDEHFTEFHLRSVKSEGKKAHEIDLAHLDRLKQKIKAS